MDIKSIFLSRTFWVTGVAPIVAAMADVLSNGFDWRQAAMAGFGALAIVLRKLTDTAVQ